MILSSLKSLQEIGGFNLICKNKVNFMKYHSEFKVIFSLPDPTEAPHIFSLLQKADFEIRQKFPEIFDVVNLDSFESNDFEDSAYAPRSVTLYEYLESDDPGKYVTTKQLLHMILAKYKRKYGLRYNIWASKIMFQNDRATKKNSRLSPVKLRV